ncbi:maleate cis-trans isomerase family protein [Halalkalicoccus jeotgali]|uniref:Asp/Glu/hydantoin racemase n=1 Tax=Halalkalicoccus jeotgali (strain DSM 18796 / CECT 7217 / JCM 14584 / KCTC 4019 / B3) TaxID=795797 RepID=D8J6C7_HALJB|nr:aspartate/glutamate racemase family protein [Halalkalicoccus jeotgali]ADJ15845.1 Asp/Glu/hydantoin racemase [Halalkalicoccus jeotgali B3]ELY37941.1 Asp/Glu/hydantoin racemase [Halalkalicoccus jeotgali B3]
MSEWRRLGVVVPSSNTAVEREFPRYVPEDVSVHASRMPLESVTAAALDSMSDRAVECAELLSHADVDAVAYACTTGSLLHGPGFDAELEKALSAAIDGPAVATALSVDRALEELGAKRIAVRTPYNEELNARERAYLEAAGYEVVSIAGLGIEDNTAIGALAPDDVTEQVASVDPDVDAVFVSCTNYPTLSAVGPLESDLGIPVVTSNGATVWDLGRAAGVGIEGPGRLFH